MEIEPFKDKIREITKLTQEEIYELIEDEQKKVIGTLHEKVALMRIVVNIYHDSHDITLFDEIKNYMELIDKDICYSENLDINTVKWYICQPDNLKLDFVTFGFGSSIELYECDCSLFLKNRICSHVEIYKSKSFDPCFIPDSIDHYSYYDGIEPDSFTLKDLLKEYPRWVLEYLFERWNEFYSVHKLANILETSSSLLTKLLGLLHAYRKNRNVDVRNRIVSMIKNKDLDVLWLTCEATDGGLTIFPEIPKNSSQFKFVHLEDNFLTFLPDSFANFVAVEKLHLQRNSLESLPESFGSLTSLIELNMDHNRLRTLPATFGNLTLLEDLKIKNNNLRALPNTFGNLESLKSLDLSNNKLISLPETFYNLSLLESLNLSNNKGLYISDSIDNMKSLKKLNLNSNRYLTFPKPICYLEHLEELSLVSNKLKSLPECIGKMTSLKYLNLNNNLIETYPLSLCNLKKLEFVRLGSYSYSIIPDFLIDFLIDLEANGVNLGISPGRFDELKQRR